ncbi:MAG: DNA primase [Clostridiales bacterium]|uniref:DNA primase n=1 Tax=Terrisporobacter sp. TaxID=1965305 RepID=UPI002A55AC4B|nr:DNA primase [Terrisporobacter sp.]MCI5628335.1 DNA primase [Clostridium sp.]MDD7755760.1 DNA primase [Clostridiales bacterium]MCI6459041.1 DNA primase [Clostridium sp.]MDY4135877.1 DNA primase [Terrisporobacter sp.]MDY6152488.1 DNA primase [Terrisporobacter sp.]
MNNMRDLIDEVKNRCDIVSVISQYINLKSSGSNYSGLCPFHNEKTGSFHVNQKKQIYKCFGCGEGGDVINFVMKIENLDFIDAIKLLAQKNGIEFKTNLSEADKAKMESIKLMQDIHLQAARFYFANLTKSKNAGYDYLKRRGLSDKTIKKFGLGYSIYSWNSLMDYLLSIGYEKKDLVKSGLVTHKEDDNKYYDRFRNRVMFPIFDYRGNVIGFGGRVLDDSLPKYLNSPDSLIFNKRFNLYGLNYAKKSIKNDTLILVEGYMDLISLYEHGIENVVATLGTALTNEQGKLIKRYASTAIISYDSDEAGIKATLRAIDILRGQNINVKILNLKDCKDPDDFIKKYKKEGFLQALEDSVSHIIFQINILKRKFDFSKDENLIKFAKEVASIIKSLSSPVEKDYYIKYVSKEFNISLDALKEEVFGKRFNNSKKSYKNFVKTEQKPIEKIKNIENGEKFVEETFIRLLMENKELRLIALLKISEEDFLINDSKEIFNLIIKNKELDKITIDKIKSLNISEEYLKDLDNISLNSINTYDSKNVDEIIRNVKRNNYHKKIEQLIQQQKKLEISLNDKSIDKDTMKEVELEIMNITLKIIDIQKSLKSL